MNFNQQPNLEKAPGLNKVDSEAETVDIEAKIKKISEQMLISAGSELLKIETMVTDFSGKEKDYSKISLDFLNLEIILLPLKNVLELSGEDIENKIKRNPLLTSKYSNLISINKFSELRNKILEEYNAINEKYKKTKDNFEDKYLSFKK